MLPVRYDVHQSQTTLFDRQQVPYIPNVNTGGLPSQLVVDIAIHLVNQAILQSTKNAARMFFFNLISQNNWQNQVYEEVLTLCLYHLQMTQQGSAGSPESLYRNSVEVVLTLYSSYLVFQYDELQSAVRPNDIQAMSQNAGVLYDLKERMKQVIPQGQHMQHIPHQQHQQPPPVWDPGMGQWVYPVAYPGMMQPQQQFHDPRMMQPPGQQFVDARGGFYHQQHPHANVYPNQGQMHPPMHPGMGFQSGAFGRAHVPHQIDFAPRPDPELTRDFNRGNRRFVRPTEERAPQTEYAVDNSAWDRHGRSTSPVSQVDYFDKSRPVDTPYEPDVITSAKNFQSNTDTKPGEQPVQRAKHEAAISAAASSPAEARIIEAVESGVDQVTVTPDVNVAVDISLSIAIANFRALRASTEGFEICRKYIYVPDPIITDFAAQASISKWFNLENLSAVATTLGRIYSGIATQPDGGGAMLTLIRELDYRITKKVNDFLLHVLGSGATIDSFIEDYPSSTASQGIPHFVMKKHGAKGAELLQIFDISLLTAFLSDMHVSEVDTITVPQNMYVAFTPSTYSVTVIPLDRQTLNLPVNLKKGETKLILSPIEHKLVYRAVKEMYLNEEQDNPLTFEEATIAIETNLLITRDGARYRIGKSFDTDEFFLKLA